MTQDSAAKRREVIDEVAARGLMGATRRGGGAFRSWVKPEVDPPMGVARCRASFFHGRDDRAPLFRAAARGGDRAVFERGTLVSGGSQKAD